MARGKKAKADQDNKDGSNSKVSRTRRVQDQGKFKIKAGSRWEQGSREIHKLFAKELNYGKTLLYI